MRENIINFLVVILYFVVFIVQRYIIYLLYIHCAQHMLNPISLTVRITPVPLCLFMCY